MSSRKRFKQAFGLALAVLFLTGCGGTLTESTATLTPTPLPPTDTPTPRPAPTSTPIPPTDTPIPLEITIRVRMDNNPNGQINIEVLEGEYQVKYGTTFWAGSKLWEEEQYLNFPVGLAIEVGPAGLTLKGDDYPQGTLLYCEKKDQLTIVGEADS